MCWIMIIVPPVSSSKVQTGISSVSHFKMWLITVRTLRIFTIIMPSTMALLSRDNFDCSDCMELCGRISPAPHYKTDVLESLSLCHQHAWKLAGIILEVLPHPHTHTQIFVCVGDITILANLFSIWMPSATLIQHHFANSVQKITALRWWPQESHIYFISVCSLIFVLTCLFIHQNCWMPFMKCSCQSFFHNLKTLV
jgi:hypothetical protein